MLHAQRIAIRMRFIHDLGNGSIRERNRVVKTATLVRICGGPNDA